MTRVHVDVSSAGILSLPVHLGPQHISPPPLPPLIPMLWATVLCAVGAYVSVVLDLLTARVVLHLGTGFMPKVEAAGCPGHPSSEQPVVCLMMQLLKVITILLGCDYGVQRS